MATDSEFPRQPGTVSSGNVEEPTEFPSQPPPPARAITPMSIRDAPPGEVAQWTTSSRNDDDTYMVIGEVQWTSGDGDDDQWLLYWVMWIGLLFCIVSIVVIIIWFIVRGIMAWRPRSRHCR